MQKSPLYATGTESSDRTSLAVEPPFLSGQMVCREPIDNEGGGENGNEIIHGSDVESYTSESGNCYVVVLNFVYSIRLILRNKNYRISTMSINAKLILRRRYYKWLRG